MCKWCCTRQRFTHVPDIRLRHYRTYWHALLPASRHTRKLVNQVCSFQCHFFSTVCNPPVQYGQVTRHCSTPDKLRRLLRHRSVGTTWSSSGASYGTVCEILANQHHSMTGPFPDFCTNPPPVMLFLEKIQINTLIPCPVFCKDGKIKHAVSWNFTLLCDQDEWLQFVHMPHSRSMPLRTPASSGLEICDHLSRVAGQTDLLPVCLLPRRKVFCCHPYRGGLKFYGAVPMNSPVNRIPISCPVRWWCPQYQAVFCLILELVCLSNVQARFLGACLCLDGSFALSQNFLIASGQINRCSGQVL